MTTDLLDIDAAIHDSIPTPDESTPEGEKPEGEDEGGTESGEKPVKEEKKDDEGGEEKPDEGETVDDEKQDESTEKPPSRFEKRHKQLQDTIDEMTRERYNLRAELEEMRLERENKPPELPTKPDPYKYSYDPNKQGDQERAVAQYNQDIGKWQAECERLTSEYENRGEMRRIRENQQYSEKMAREKSIYGTFEAAKATFSNIKIPEEMHTAFLYDENSTDLCCFLGNPKNSKILENVLSATGYRQSQMLAEISYKLQAAKNRPKQTKAPAPPAKPSKSGSAGGGTQSLEDMPFDKYREKMSKAKEKLNNKWR